MLEFIVLGLVPGTHIQLNFNDVMMISFTVFLLLHIITTVYRYYTLLKMYDQAGTFFTIVARKRWLTRRIKNLDRVEYSGHKAEVLPVSTAAV